MLSPLVVPSVVQLGHMAVPFKPSEKPPYWISLMFKLVYTPPAWRGFFFPTSSSAFALWVFGTVTLGCNLLTTGPPWSISLWAFIQRDIGDGPWVVSLVDIFPRRHLADPAPLSSHHKVLFLQITQFSPPPITPAPPPPTLFSLCAPIEAHKWFEGDT